MPAQYQAIGETTPKLNSLQFEEHRIQGVPLLIPSGAGVTSVSNRRIVSVQEDSTNGIRYLVVSPIAITYNYVMLTLIGWAVLEQALQQIGTGPISADPYTFYDGYIVSAWRKVGVTYMIDYDPANKPTLGIGTAYLDVQGRLTSVSGGGNLALAGAVFDSVPGMQMTNQLLPNTLFYQLKDALTP